MLQKQVLVWKGGENPRGLRIPAQRHGAQPIPPMPLGILCYQSLFSSTVFLLLRKDQNTYFFFFPSMFQTLFLTPVFHRTLKCFIFIPSQNKDILQWLEILLWSRMIIFHLAFWMLTKASRRIHFRLQISPGYSEIAASVVGLLAQTYVKHFLCILSQALWVWQ